MVGNKEVRSMVFRRQVLYFIVLVVCEMPYAVFLNYLGYVAKVVPPDQVLQKFLDLQSLFGFMVSVYMMRAIILPVFRFFEPSRAGKSFRKLFGRNFSK